MKGEKEPCFLVLEDGTVISGEPFGSRRQTDGEIGRLGTWPHVRPCYVRVCAVLHFVYKCYLNACVYWLFCDKKCVGLPQLLPQIWL